VTNTRAIFSAKKTCILLGIAMPTKDTAEQGGALIGVASCRTIQVTTPEKGCSETNDNQYLCISSHDRAQIYSNDFSFPKKCLSIVWARKDYFLVFLSLTNIHQSLRQRKEVALIDQW